MCVLVTSLELCCSLVGVCPSPIPSLGPFRPALPSLGPFLPALPSLGPFLPTSLSARPHIQGDVGVVRAI